MNKLNKVQIPDYIVMLLIERIKNLDRKIFLYFLAGIISFFTIYYLTEIFGRIIQFLLAFITGIFFWLSIIGCFLERRNILEDLENGEMYYIENAKKVEKGFLYNNIIYETLEDIDILETDGYILPVSRIFIKN